MACQSLGSSVARLLLWPAPPQQGRGPAVFFPVLLSKLCRQKLHEAYSSTNGLSMQQDFIVTVCLWAPTVECKYRWHEGAGGNICDLGSHGGHAQSFPVLPGLSAAFGGWCYFPTGAGICLLLLSGTVCAVHCNILAIVFALANEYHE